MVRSAIETKLTPLANQESVRRVREAIMGAETPQLHTVIDRDGGTILDIDQGQITTLNPTGAFVWQALKRGEAVESIVAGISLDSGEPAPTVDRDVRGFIETLRANNLLP